MQQLPEYHRLSGGEDPPDYFRGETSNSGSAVTDLDEFLQRVYQYYCDKGFWCILTQWLCELISLGFTIAFSGFLLLFVNWTGLLNVKCGTHNCDLVKEAFHEHPFTPFTLTKAFFVLYLVLLAVYWLFCFLRFFTQLRETLEIRHFIDNSLAVSEHDLQTMAWPALVDKIVQLQQHERLCVVRQLSAHDMVSRVMRKENYLIGLVNKGVLGLDLPWWVPGAGPMLNRDRKRLVLTKMVEWSLNWCILQHMFDSNFLIHRDFTSNPARLRKRLVVLGVSMLLLSPFYVIFMFFYFLLRNTSEFYHNPSSMGTRRWSNLAKWSFREFNELEHMFKHRLNSSYKHAVEYVKHFPSPVTSMIARLVSYIAGSFAAVILFISFIDESLLEGHIGQRHNLIWYTAIVGTVLVVSRSLIAEDHEKDSDPAGVMRQITSHTHYMPKHWRGAENTERVRSEFQGLFKFKAALFIEEIMSIIVTPFILIFALPKCVDDVLLFVQDFTVHIDGVGHVCSLSVFDFEHHGNSKYGSPCHTSKDRRSSQGKMEQSFISFKTNYPNWEPDRTGKQFMSDFRLRWEENDLAKVQLHSSVRLPPPPRWGRPSSATNASSDQLQRSLTEVHPDQIKFNTASQSQQDRLKAGTVDQSVSTYSGVVVSRVDPTEMNLQASSSRGILENQGEAGHTSRWWTRNGPSESTGAPGESSFFRPPQFAGRTHLAESQDDHVFYEGEEDHQWSSQRSTTLGSSQISVEESPSLEFPFGDVYRRPRQ